FCCEHSHSPFFLTYLVIRVQLAPVSLVQPRSYVVISLLRSAAHLRTLLGMAVILGVVSAQAGAGTLALFTDTASSASNTFQTGNVDLQLLSVANTTANCTGTYADTLASALFNYDLN